MRYCCDAAVRADTAQQRAVADPSRAENNVLPVGQIVRRIDLVEILFEAVGDQFLSFLLIARPHLTLHVATQAFDSRRCEHCFRRTADAHVRSTSESGNDGAMAAAMSPS